MDMLKKAIYKVPNGKLLKVALTANNGRIGQLKITGDFFLYPEEDLQKLEEALIHCQLEKTALESVCREFQKKHGTQFFGLTGESLAHTILLASQQSP